MSYKEQIKKEKLPQHVAIIMDGNGRWAKQKGNIRIYGHQNGVKAVRETVEAAAELGIGYLTLYAFSTENWKRPKYEVDALMTLLVSTINEETETLQKNNVRLTAIGDIKALPADVAKNLKEAIEKTAQNSGLTLVLALNYSARWELINAAKKIARAAKSGDIAPEQVNEELLAKNLETSEIPDPELLIRTSGEYRISNFLLWQIAYAELYFTKILWPDFRKENLYEAIVNYQCRERRFGKTSEQMQNECL